MIKFHYYVDDLGDGKYRGRMPDYDLSAYGDSLGQVQERMTMNVHALLITLIDHKRTPVPLQTGFREALIHPSRTVVLDLSDSFKVLIWNEMNKQDIIAKELALMMGCPEQQIDRLLSIGVLSGVALIHKALVALKVPVNISLGN
jgi:hypothetical protein